MTDNNNNNNERIISKEEEQEAKQRQQKQLIDQLRLLKRLIESQEKGENITFDPENPYVRKEIEELMNILRKKVRKEGEGERA
jgi:hypothetical protein